MLKKNKALLIDLLFIFILSLTPLLWFKEGMIMVGHDNVFPLDPIEFLKGRLYTWSYQGVGRDQSTILGTLPIHLLDALPYLFGFSLQTTQKIVYCFWFFFLGFSIYVLASTINKTSRVFKLTSVILYQFNFFVLQGWWIAERSKFSALIAFPLILSVFFKVSQGKIKPLKAAIYNSLILLFFNGGGLYGFALFGGFLTAFFLFFAYFFFLAFSQKNYQLIKNLIITIIFSLLGFALINAYFLLPALTKFFVSYQSEIKGSGGFSGFVDWALEISAGSSFLNLFRLQGIPEWYDNPQHPYAKFFLNNPLLIALSFLWPALTFSSMIIKHDQEKSKIVLYFSLVYLVSFFFAAGTHPPLGFIYAFLMRKVPGFVIFRSPYFKFASALFLANSFLIAFLIDHFQGFLKKFFFVSFTLIWLAYHFPYFQGNFFAWQKNLSTRLKIPDYVYEFAHWANQEKEEEGRILLLPPFSFEWQYDTYRWGYLSLFPLARLLTQEPILVNESGLMGGQQHLLRLTYQSLADRDQELFRKLSTHLGIKYLLLRNDTFYDLNWVKSDSPQLYQEVLLSFDFVKHLKSFGEWDLYKVEIPLTRFYTTKQLSSLNLPIEEIENYYNFSADDFFFREEAKKALSPLSINSYLKADCLTCKEKFQIFTLPKRALILPDSPFYFLIRFNEQLKLKEALPEVAIYDYLGLSLKRLVEVRRFIQRRQPGELIKEKHFLLYNQTLAKIEELFGKITDFKTQYEAAHRLEFYLKNEEDYLRVFIGELVSNEDELKIIGKTFDLIASLRGKVKPYLAGEGIETRKLYIFTIDHPADYQVLVKRESLGESLKFIEEVKLKMDNQIEKSLSQNSLSKGGDWLEWDRIHLNPGGHKLIIETPVIRGSLSDFKEEAIKMRTRTDRCYQVSIKEFDNQKTYELKIDYQGGLSDDFSAYFSTQLKEEKSHRAVKLGPSQGITKEIFYPDPRASNRQIGFCGPELDLETLKAKTKLELSEVVEPVIILSSHQAQPGEVKSSLEMEKINPTKYLVEIKDLKRPLILVFSELFDSGWQIKNAPSSSHFTVNGYANGWLLENGGESQLIIEYKPQKLFYLGLLISSLTIINCLAYLKLKKTHD